MRLRGIAAAALAFGLALALGGLAARAAPEPETEPANDGSDLELAAEDEDEPQGERVARDAVEIDAGVLARSDDGRSLAIVVRADGSETFVDLARRAAGDEAAAEALAAANGFSSAADAPEGPVEVPWELARAEYRYLALRAIFPRDRFEKGAWVHRPAEAALPSASESLWQVALWFTGDGERWPELARANGIEGPNLPRAGPVRVSAELLLPLFQPARSGPGGLTYGEDEEGPYATYRMARGEALYSGVVLRFTDLTRPADVNAAAEVVRRRSGIDDVRRIPVGARIRIPLDLLSPGYLPANHPRRVLASLHEDEIEELAPEPRAIALEGVHVLLDPGHGGEDVGARNHTIWESDYVYDVACRVRRLLEKDTSATVRLLVRDTQYGCRVFDRKVLPRNQREVVDADPPVRITRGRTKSAVNRRYQLANEIYRDLTNGKEVPSDNVVFVSLHADSLHKSVRGSTVYVAGERFGAKGRGAKAQKASSRADRLRDEAASRRLAEALLDGYRAEGLPVHPNRPVRDRVVRGQGRRASTWVPAVLKHNEVPTKVLLETINISNTQDAKILESPEGREKIARAVVAGLLRFYSGERVARGGHAGAGRASDAGAAGRGNGAGGAGRAGARSAGRQ